MDEPKYREKNTKRGVRMALIVNSYLSVSFLVL